MDTLYLDILAAFEAKKLWYTRAGLQPPRVIDEYQGQPENPEYFEFALPAIFIDYSTNPKKQGNYWVNDTDLVLHCMPEIGPSKSNISPRKADGLKTTRWYAITKQILDTVKGEHYTTLVRGPERPAFSPAGPYHTISARTQFDEVDGNQVDKSVPVTIDNANITGGPKTKYVAF